MTFDPRRLNWVHADPSCSCDAEHGAVPSWRLDPEGEPVPLAVSVDGELAVVHPPGSPVGGWWQRGVEITEPGDTGPGLWWAWMGGDS